MRLFVGDPVWTPFNRPHDHLPARSGLFPFFPLNVMSFLSTCMYVANTMCEWPLYEISRIDLVCRKEYVKAFVQKEVGDHAVNAAA